MKKIIDNIIYAGTTATKSQCQNRNIMLTNTINLTIFLTALFINAVEVVLYFMIDSPLSYGTYRISLLAVVGILNLLLSRIGYPGLSKFMVTVFPVAILAYFPTLFGLFRDEYLLYVPFGIVALSLIPHFIFSYQKQKLIYIVSIIYFLAMLLAYDIVIIEMISVDIPIVTILKDNMAYYKLSQIAIFSFINLSVFYLRRRNTIYEEKLEEQSKRLESRNIELKESGEELVVQNEELISYQDEINLKNEKLNETLTELKTAQARLIDAEKMASLGILTAGVAHEINNPINYIYSGISAIENYMEENCEHEREDLKPFFEAIDIGIERTINIVKSLGRYSRSEDLPWTKVDIHQVIDDALVMLYNQYKDRIKINKNYAAGNSYVLANEGQMHQVLLNILLNSIQAIPGEGFIDIKTKTVNESLIVTIEDSGKGISEKNLKHIFDPFFTTKDPGEGTGLGLSIAKKIIMEHKGNVKCQSVLQKGTTFVISMPTTTEL